MRRPAWPTPHQGVYVIDDFYFTSGETLPKLRIHYQTLGRLDLDEYGHATNAVLILHGTGGSGDQFLQNIFAGELFGRGQLLDASKYFIILRDGIGHGRSSKPSDRLRAKFPRYGYRDMVRADHVLLTAGLGVDHLRLVMGTSMGGMQSWLWAGIYPDFMDAVMPLASLPAQIAGRNRMSRKMIIDSIKLDQAWEGGDYTTQPVRGMTSALYIIAWMGSVPLLWQKQAPDRDSADAFLDELIANSLQGKDANDMIYQFAASADYNPVPILRNITAHLVAVNSADDQINPPELPLLKEGIKQVTKGRAVVLPISEDTRGHATHTHARLWKDQLQRLLADSERSA